MPNPIDLQRLSSPAEWRTRRSTAPDLADADLSGRVLCGYSFDNTDLRRANLRDTLLTGCSFAGADLRGANLSHADGCRSYFLKTRLSQADMTDASFSGACFLETDLRDVDFRRSKLRMAQIVGCDLRGALLDGSSVFGVAMWDSDLSGASQRNLIITHDDEQIVTTDSIEVAQFLYLLLNNQKIRQVLDSITSKAVLILGRFTPERKVVLDAIRDELRNRDYLPVLFDFEKPSSRDITETVSTLAHMARFVIADITDAKSIPQELMAFVPTLPSVPVQPLLLVSQREYGMFEHFKRYPWVLEPFVYEDQDRLLAVLNERVIQPAEAKAIEQTGR
ncbi:pentapeptide repeat-containing protein [Paludibaculum fermentans]|uniref:pentapeptide repeat-containing protein n=1 Tax=Paludibaculum fermentans TaxID=1473598 RepID=UPI003EB85E43